MKTLTAPTQSAAAATVKRPIWLVRIDFITPIRLCSSGDVTWSGDSWLGADLSVSGLQSTADGGQGGQLQIGDAGSAMAALILGEGIADRPIRIWQAYAGALADQDPVQVFAGTGDDADIGNGRVRISLAPDSSRHMRSPREYGGDFSYVQPEGFIVAFNNERYSLGR